MIIPLTIGVRADEQQTEGHEIANAANTMGPPYQVPDSNFGWSARDACYSFGSYDLAEDEALVITHRPPTVRFWSFCVWNQYMANHTRRRRAHLGQHRHARCPTPTAPSRSWSATARPRTPTR